MSKGDKRDDIGFGWAGQSLPAECEDLGWLHREDQGMDTGTVKARVCYLELPAPLPFGPPGDSEPFEGCSVGDAARHTLNHYVESLVPRLAARGEHYESLAARQANSQAR